MGAVQDAFNIAFRDFVTAGIPASGEYEPDKALIRAIGPIIEQLFAVTGLSDKPYETPEDGAAATTDGVLFWVKGSGTEAAHLYKNVGGAAVDQGIAIPSTLALNTRPQSVAAQGPRVIWDRHDLMGGGMNCIYWPLNSRAYDIVMGDDLANTVANAECEELLGYSKIVLSATDAAWALVLDMDTKLLAAMLFNDAKALLNSKPGRVKILISKWGETLDTTLDVVDLANAVGENMVANGRTMDGWDMTGVVINSGDAYGPAAGGNITGRGFTKWWQAGVAGGEVLTNWRSRSIRSRGEFGFVRMYVGLDAPVDLSGAVMQVHLFNDSGAYLATKDVPCERKLSDYEYVFAGRFIIDQDNVREIRVGLAAGVSGAAKAGLTGAQLYVGDREVYTIGLQDYPVCTASRRFCASRHIFLTSGRDLPFYMSQIGQRKDDFLDLVATIYAGGATFGNAPYERQGDRIYIDPAKIKEAAGGVTLRPHDKPSRRFTMDTTFHVGPLSGAGAVRLHAVGNSIVNREAPVRAAKVLEALGYAVQCVGTMINGGGGTNNAPSYGGEGREGIQSAHYTNELTDYAIPLPAGQEAAYRAMTDEQKRGYNPYLVASSPGANVYNGQRWSMDHYLTRFGYDDPTHIFFDVLRNDINFQTPATALAQVQRAFNAFYDSSRSACPDAHIGFMVGGEGRTDGADEEWYEAYWPILTWLTDAIENKRVGGDAKVWLIGGYQHISGETGWGVSTDSTDALTGARVESMVDSTHPQLVARAQYAEVVSAWVHSTCPVPARFWGVSGNTALTGAQVVALTGSELSSARAKAFSVAAADQYVYFAYLASLGDPTGYAIGGFAESYVKTVVSATTAAGHTADYIVLRSTNKLTGTVPVEVK